MSGLLEYCKLHEFFIYNPKFAGKKEGQEYTKMLFFHPKFVNEDRQCMSMGLSEALTNFTKYVRAALF